MVNNQILDHEGLYEYGLKGINTKNIPAGKKICFVWQNNTGLEKKICFQIQYNFH